MAGSINASTLRLTGMASGLDTESIVKGLMTASNTKLQTVQKQKTKLEWKQTAYKDILSKLSSFQTKYFGTSATSSSSTILGSSLTKLGASYSSPYVSISTGANSSAGSMYISDIVSLASSAKLSGNTGVSANPTIEVDTGNLDELAGKSVSFTLNGVRKTITFSDKTYSSISVVRDELNAQLQSVFGFGKITVTGMGDSISLAASNSQLSMSVPADTAQDPSGVLNFGSYTSNRLSLTTAVSDAGFSSNVVGQDDTVAFQINGKAFSFAATSSMNDITKAVNASDAGVKMSYSTLTDSFTLTATETGATSSISFEDTSGSMMSSLFGGGTLTAGTDAEIRLSLNGSTDEADMITLKRSTNVFDVDGTQISLLGKASGDAQEGIGVTLAYDSEAISKKITDFVNDYNELLKTLTGKLSEEIYKDYQPLTDDEKEALSDDEVKLWEEKAKSGLLRGDSNLSSIVSELRTSMNSIIKSMAGETGSSMMLSDMGISTGVYSEKGQIHIDVEKLKAAIESDAQKVLSAFTQKSSISYSAYSTTEQQSQRFSESGVLWRISDILSKNLATVGRKGALITLVGSPNSTLKNSDYAKRISNMEEKIELMKEKLVDEEDRYWSRFTAMEEALSNLQSQSGWISSMLGGSGSN